MLQSQKAFAVGRYLQRYRNEVLITQMVLLRDFRLIEKFQLLKFVTRERDDSSKREKPTSGTSIAHYVCIEEFWGWDQYCKTFFSTSMTEI